MLAINFIWAFFDQTLVRLSNLHEGTLTHSLGEILRLGHKWLCSLLRHISHNLSRKHGWHWQRFVKNYIYMKMATLILYLLHKVFQICYSDHFKPDCEQEWRDICQEFVDSILVAYPGFSGKLKIHLFLHIVDCMKDFGPTSSYCTERYLWTTIAIHVCIFVFPI